MDGGAGVVAMETDVARIQSQFMFFAYVVVSKKTLITEYILQRQHLTVSLPSPSPSSSSTTVTRSFHLAPFTNLIIIIINHSQLAHKYAPNLYSHSQFATFCTRPQIL